jgi:hypothetical protein
MRKTFTPLDDVLIERVFQPVADLITNQVGLSSRTAACVCIDAASLAWIISRARGLSDAVTAWDCVTACLDLALLLLGLAALSSLRTVFRRATGKKQGNPLRLAMQPHRAVILLMLAARVAQLQSVGLSDAADAAMLICSAAALYLGACAERPPVRRRSKALMAAP